MRCFGKLQSLGSFKTPEEAFLAYKTAKEGYIKEVAEVWRGKIEAEYYYLKGMCNYLLSWGFTKDSLGELRKSKANKTKKTFLLFTERLVWRG